MLWRKMWLNKEVAVAKCCELKLKWGILAFTAAIFFLGSGVLYRLFAQRLDALSLVRFLPAIPLQDFPYKIGPWEGVDVPISDTVLKVAANDDYVSRLYVDKNRNMTVSLYVAYTAEPRRMMGHRPTVCYVASGWIHDGSEQTAIETLAGTEIPCMIHRFHRPGLAYQDAAVVNYYVVNGVLTSDHKSFSGIRWRRPKITNGRPDYVAQIQMVSGSEQASRTLAADISDQLLRHFSKTE
jgi:EpsI family protein